MKIALDTNRYSDMARGDAEVVARVLGAEEVYVPVIVLGELRAGFRRGTREAANEAALAAFLARPFVHVLAVDQATTVFYGGLEADLRVRGAPIPTNDVWIAALTLQHGLTLYSRDPHFDHLPSVPRV
jgi:predicted nucleic acid-binding protein